MVEKNFLRLAQGIGMLLGVWAIDEAIGLTLLMSICRALASFAIGL